MAQDKEAFLSRWSRLKQEQEKAAEKAAEQPGAPVPAQEPEPPALPPVESLTSESDFRGFMHPKVGDALRRVALKKLFSDPHFNVEDPYEAYSGDWTGGEPIPPEMLATLKHARSVLFREEDEEKARLAEQEKLAEHEETKPEPDEPGRKDT
jgi:hypothetical protein